MHAHASRDIYVPACAFDQVDGNRDGLERPGRDEDTKDFAASCEALGLIESACVCSQITHVQLACVCS